jgi:ankyrin repeat protein
MDLFEAIKRGHEDDVSRLLDAYPDSLEQQDYAYDRHRPLTWAACNGRVGMVTLLVQRGANIHATGRLSRTALHMASSGGHEEMVAWLLSQGAGANTTDESGQTPLSLAAAGVHLGVVKMLVHHMEAQGLEGRDMQGRKALYYAAQKGHETIVAFLLRQGAHADIRGDDETMPLMAAASGGHLGVVKMLLQHMGGEGLEQTDKKNRTALFCAALTGREEMVAFLLSQGAQVDIRSSRSVTMLMAAADGGHVGVVKVLMKHMGGEGLNHRDNDGGTALFHAAERGREETVRVLLLAGANPTLTGRGKTPLRIAHVKGHQGCVEVFDVSTQTSMSAMHSRMPIGQLSITLCSTFSVYISHVREACTCI